MRKVLFFAAAGMFTALCAKAQVIATFTVKQHQQYIAEPVCIDLDPLTRDADSTLQLVEVSKGKRMPVSFQIEKRYHRFLWWMMQPTNKESIFELEKVNNKHAVGATQNTINIKDDNGTLLVTDAGKKVLQYNYATMYPPKGVDTVFRRSGFIHPLWSPDGNVMTRINAPDHYHHFGLWNPWTEVSYRGKIVDFWNLVKKEGTVRFAKFISKDEGSVFGGFKALQEHVVLNDPAGENVAMNEEWDVRVYNIGDKKWLWDFTSVLNCATTDTVFLKEYRYGGFGYRATEQWNDDNSKVLTSENKTRKDADASTARWCMLDGAINNGHSGILFMSFPANYNYPEPMRVWPEKMNGRGDVFFSFSPTRNKDWTLAPGKDHVLKYRMLVYEGTITAEKAEKTWQAFANPPEIKIVKKN
jgi:hypothetical protein